MLHGKPFLQLFVMRLGDAEGNEAPHAGHLCISAKLDVGVFFHKEAADKEQ